MKLLFERKVLIPFHMSDPAGILFFGNIFALAHSAYESWIAEKVEWSEWFGNGEWIAPIRKAEADYLKPLRAGEAFDVKFYVKSKGESSFTLTIEFLKDSQCHVRLETTQVFCDKKTIKKIPIPQKAQRLLGD